ncbi:MAG: Asp23/Gls24 family envelope stress response protein [Rubrobacteraceae bacterium]
MSEAEQQEQEQQEQESPLYSDRGATNIADTVVSQIVDLSVDDVEGIRPGKTTTHVGKYEVAVDFNMEMEYGRDLPELTSALRTKIKEQVGWMTGLQVVEQNVIVTDVFFPDEEEEQPEEGIPE